MGIVLNVSEHFDLIPFIKKSTLWIGPCKVQTPSATKPSYSPRRQRNSKTQVETTQQDQKAATT